MAKRFFEGSFEGSLKKESPQKSFFYAAVILLALGLVFVSCEPAVQSLPNSTTVTGVTVSPNPVTVAAGGSQQFTATVSGDNVFDQTVTWSIDAPGIDLAADTKISTDGVLSVDLNEPNDTLTVKATSNADSSKSGTAVVTINGQATVDNVTVSPNPAEVAKGGTQTFTATVKGENNPHQTVTWSIATSGIATGTKISSDGILSVDSYETNDALTVKATSTVDTSKFGTATVTLIGAATVSDVTVNPAMATIAQGGTQTFTATVEGDNNPDQTVTWSIKESGRSAKTTINSNGVLTVAGDETLTSLTVVATSTVDTSKSGTALVIVAGTATVTAVTVSPATSSATQGGTKTFTAAVTGTNNPRQTVTWSIVESDKSAGTTINGNGVLTVALDEELPSLTVKATSTVDTSKSGTAVVTVTSPSSITIDDINDLENRLLDLHLNDTAHPYYTVIFSSKAAVDINSSEWGTINDDVQTATRYVILDLSNCAASSNTITGENTPQGDDFNIIKNNAYIKAIILPDALTNIGQGAFFDCANLTGVTISSSVTSIGEAAFLGCSSLMNITIPSGVTSIGNEAFSGCSSLAGITIPGNISSIGDYTFNECANLVSISIPSGVTSIGNYAFYDCSSLTSFTIPSGVTSIGVAALSKTGITSISIPSGVTSIMNMVFADCTSLTSVTIPPSVISIGESAFAVTGITSITIPGNVTSIADMAFYSCAGLTSVTFSEGSNISDSNFGGGAFPEGEEGYGGNTLKTAYSTGKAGVYTRAPNGSTWSKSS